MWYTSCEYALGDSALISRKDDLMSTLTKTQNVVTVSDLHLFCRRTEAQRHIRSLHNALDDADIFVFNGDIFDFKWTTLNSIEDTVDAAIHWLARFVSRAPSCRFYYLLGNHDSNPRFIEALDDFAEPRENFTWHSDHVKLANTLFLHGEASMRKMNTSDLVSYRNQWMKKDKKKGRVLNHLYDRAFKAGVHKQLPKVAFPNQRVVERLNHYLKNIGHGRDSGTQAVYFGHTHVAVSDYRYNGIRYWNCGAPLPGMEFNILQTQIPLGN